MADETVKPRASLIPRGVMTAVARVLTKAVAKHGDASWQKISREEHYDALERHKESWWLGEDVDPESGESHLAHVITRAMFLWWLDDNAESLVGEFTDEFIAQHAPMLARLQEAIARAKPETIPARASISPRGDVEWKCDPLPGMLCLTSGEWRKAPGDAAPTVCSTCGSPTIKVRVNGKEI